MLRKMKPGQPGTKQFLEQYGEQLVCVRYRYDAQMRKRIKTIELVVAETEWLPPAERFAKDEIVWQQRLRAAGGKWDSQRCVWNIRYDAAVKLGYATNVERREVSL
jgi:hypothetical protein